MRALEDVAARAMGAEPCRGSIRIQKLAEGASNKVFIAIGHGQRAIVKIPDPVVPARFVTASEVATLEYLRTELAIPVPKVFAWSTTSDNPVGCEYIIMEELSVGAKTSARFCLGPLAKHEFLDPSVRAAGVDCGPCKWPRSCQF